MKRSVFALAAALACCSASAQAAVPDIDTTQGDLVCTGLLDIAFHGASSVRSPSPEVVTPILAAFTYFIGRLSQAEPTATKDAALQAAAKLTPQEKTAYGAECMKKTGPALGAFLR
jgi:hypothetical protein